MLLITLDFLFTINSTAMNMNTIRHTDPGTQSEGSGCCGNLTDWGCC
ncbi:MAG TPA: hypothetical protein VG870_06125 [Chitinophagaceae bacterium]|nr:hypothetical protein [Chitinophagaceae bacterium]